MNTELVTTASQAAIDDIDDLLGFMDDDFEVAEEIAANVEIDEEEYAKAIADIEASEFDADDLKLKQLGVSIDELNIDIDEPDEEIDLSDYMEEEIVAAAAITIEEVEEVEEVKEIEEEEDFDDSEEVVDFGAIEFEDEPEDELNEEELAAIVKSAKSKASKESKPETIRKDPSLVKISAVRTASAADMCEKVGLPLFHIFEKKELTLSDEQKEAKLIEVKEMIDAMPVKVRENAIKLIKWLNNSGSPCTFCRSSIKYITENEEITKKDWKDFFMSQRRNGIKPYGESTANPQHNNYLQLFLGFKIIKPKGAGYELNDDSIYLEKILNRI